MEFGLAIVLFIAGLLLIIKGGDWFVDSASWIAHAAKTPTFIVGATIVSIATTLPELTVSIMANITGKNEMTIGNATGTVLANLGLVLGVAITFMTIKTPRKIYWPQYVILIISTILLWLGCLGGNLEIWLCIVLILICISFFIINLIQGKQEQKVDQSPAKNNLNNKTKIKASKLMLVIFFFLFGAICIIAGSNFLIHSGSAIASYLGISERIVAITMIALGTSLPELVTTIIAIQKKEGGLSIGNIIGATIINITLILSICSLISKNNLVISKQTLMIDFPFCLAFSLIAVIPMFLKQRTYHWQGILLLIGYITYLSISVLF